MTPDRFRGALVGLATGDALGTTVEFTPYGTYPPLTDIVGGGPFNLEPGQWTDDTSMALCLGESLIACGQLDPKDAMVRFCRWYRQGHMSCTGRCFDIGNSTRSALQRFETTGDPMAGSTDPRMAGNGSLMRLAPVPMLYARQPIEAITQAARSSALTHGARTAIDACRYYAGLLVGALEGRSKEELLADHFDPTGEKIWAKQPLASEVAEIAAGSFKHKRPPDIVGSGYVVRSLEAALWAFHTTDDYRGAVLRAANLGDDADTVAAIAGQLAGAFHGHEAIPAPWRARLAWHDRLVEMSDRLLELSGRDPTRPR